LGIAFGLEKSTGIHGGAFYGCVEPPDFLTNKPHNVVNG
jgi:hypothetical protein